MIVWIRRFPRRIELQEEWDVTRLSFSALGIARYQSQSQFIRQLRTKPKFLYLGGIEMSDETKKVYDAPDWVKRARMHLKILTVLGWICVSGGVFGVVYKLVFWIKDVVK